MTASEHAALMNRRGELLAEMFLNDLGASITRSPIDSADYLAFFETGEKALQFFAVEVKATEKPLPSKYAVTSTALTRAAQFNIPTLLLVVDVKQNKIGCAWLDEYARTHQLTRLGSSIRIPLMDAAEHGDQIREHLLATAVAPI